MKVNIYKKIGNNKPEEYHFILKDGSKVRDLKELVDKLEEMSDKLFNEHVNEIKNDFYDWAKKICEDRQLVHDLLECTTREAMLFCLKSKMRQAGGLVSLDKKTKKLVKKCKKIDSERFNKLEIKKIKAQLPSEIIKKLKEVYQIG